MTKKLTPEQLEANRLAGKVRGRPAFVPTPEQRAYVLQMTGLGATQELIAGNMRFGEKIGIDEVTLRAHFAPELAAGTAQANLKVAGTLFRMATSGENIAATIFWLKVRARWRESPTALEVTGKDGDPLHPAQEPAVPIEDYKAALRDVLKEF